MLISNYIIHYNESIVIECIMLPRKSIKRIITNVFIVYILERNDDIKHFSIECHNISYLMVHP